MWIAYIYNYVHLGVSKNSGTPKSSILIGFSIINHPFWGTPIFGNTHDTSYLCMYTIDIIIIYIYIYIIPCRYITCIYFQVEQDQ